MVSDEKTLTGAQVRYLDRLARLAAVARSNVEHTEAAYQMGQEYIADEHNLDKNERWTIDLDAGVLRRLPDGEEGADDG